MIRLSTEIENAGALIIRLPAFWDVTVFGPSDCVAKCDCCGKQEFDELWWNLTFSDDTETNYVTQ